MILLLALLIGIIAGLRAFMVPAAISIAATYGHLPIEGTPLAFLSYRFTPWMLSTVALLELIADQLPGTPSRKVPVQLGARLLTGGLSGAAIGLCADMVVPGLLAGVVGAMIGTFGGATARARLAAAFGADRPAALLEDAVAIIGAALIVAALP